MSTVDIMLDVITTRLVAPRVCVQNFVYEQNDQCVALIVSLMKMCVNYVDSRAIYKLS